MSSVSLNAYRTGGGISIEMVNQGTLLPAIAQQLPYIRALALNRAGEEAVAEVRAKAKKIFTTRGDVGRRFIDLSFQVTQYATKENPVVAFGVSRALLQGRAAQLIDHEDGAERRGTGRNNFPYLPAISSARPTENDLLPRWLYPKALGLIDSKYLANGFEQGRDRTAKRRGSTRGKRAQQNAKGFILRDESGDPLGIFRRVPLMGMRRSSTREGGRKLTLSERRRRGSGQSTLELLFYTPKVIKIKPKLGFQRMAEHALITNIEDSFAGMLAYALDEARQASNASWLQIDGALIRQFRPRARGLR